MIWSLSKSQVDNVPLFENYSNKLKHRLEKESKLLHLWKLLWQQQTAMKVSYKLLKNEESFWTNPPLKVFQFINISVMSRLNSSLQVMLQHINELRSGLWVGHKKNRIFIHFSTILLLLCMCALSHCFLYPNSAELLVMDCYSDIHRVWMSCSLFVKLRYLQNSPKPSPSLHHAPQFCFLQTLKPQRIQLLSS